MIETLTIQIDTSELQSVMKKVQQIEGVAAQLYTFDLAATGASRSATWHLISTSLAAEYRRQAAKMIEET